MHIGGGKTSSDSLWDLLRDEDPDIYSTIHRMPKAQECLKKVLGDDCVPVWGDEDWRMAVYVLVGDLLQRIEKLNSLYAESPERIASAEKARRKWKTFGKTVKSVLFKNELGEISEVPIEILEIIVNDLPFHGSIRDAGREVEFVREGKVLAKVCKTLMDQLRGEGKGNRYEERRQREEIG